MERKPFKWTASCTLPTKTGATGLETSIILTELSVKLATYAYFPETRTLVAPDKLVSSFKPPTITGFTGSEISIILNELFVALATYAYLPKTSTELAPPNKVELAILPIILGSLPTVCVKLPEARCNDEDGAVVPIPTFPSLSIKNLAVLLA